MEKAFKKAQPIWLKGREKEMHIRMQAKTVIDTSEPEKTVVRLATSGIFQLWVNGKFASYGPARAGKGHFRIDEWDITEYLSSGKNAIVIEACGYYAYNFYIQKQPSFLIAEVVSGGQVLAWTGEHFTARLNPYYIQKAQRYSFQRPMLETYNISGKDTFFTDDTMGKDEIEITDGGVFVERRALYPDFEHLRAERKAAGKIIKKELENPCYDRSCLGVNPETLSGFTIDELDVFVTRDCLQMDFDAPTVSNDNVIHENEYALYELPINCTGMLSLNVATQKDIKLYVCFDEILNPEGLVDFNRGGCTNAIRYDLIKGEHNLQFFEVYTMKHIQIIAVGGDCTVSNIEMIEYKHPAVDSIIDTTSPSLNRIIKAATECFLQNNVDVCTDCPSRERAGWLCDSFFSGRVEKLLTGENLVEKSFLENFLHEDSYSALPDGMVPMCYPADHMNGEFIPNWSLWLVIELEEYYKRSGDLEFIQAFSNKIDKLLNYFAGFENEDGLLEKLESWVFVEWSKANELVQDVNYPSNMLYCAALKSAARLYDRPEFSEKADKIKEEILKQSFDGEFFVDNAVRENGVLKSTGERTEVCQYYAFFFGIADTKMHSELLNRLVNDFGSDRNLETTWPEIYPANAFIGNYLRLDILMRQGYYKRVLEDIDGYFDYMAKRTGTLWENVTSTASCNHGFAAYVLYWLNELNQKGYIS